MRRRFGRHALFALAVSLVSIALIATPVLASCYGSNHGAWRHPGIGGGAHGVETTRSLFDRTPATNTVIAHPMQVQSPISSDFVGWGTYRGGPVAGSCATHTAGSWRVYIDGVNNGVYYCLSTFGTVGLTATSQVFQLNYQACLSFPYNAQWVAFLNGSFKICRDMDGGATSLADVVSAGGESAPSSSTNDIDVHFTAARYRNSAWTWVNWGVGINCQDVGYTLLVVSNTNFWAQRP